ncbi:MAG TPA: hypothetical protein VK188_15190 [Holophaga sp.]|nr:hypothetical protein [Holophaga sp.]
MVNRLVSAATLFTAGAIFAGGSAPLGAAPLATSGAGSALVLSGSCGAQDGKKDDTAKPPASDKEKKGKAKDGSCGAGSCGSKDKKGKKEGSCGKDKKEGSCGKEKK